MSHIASTTSTALVALLYGIYHPVTALEWVTTALFSCYVSLLGAETNRLASERMDRSTTTVTRWAWSHQWPPRQNL